MKRLQKVETSNFECVFTMVWTVVVDIDAPIRIVHLYYLHMSMINAVLLTSILFTYVYGQLGFVDSWR